jgi:hypothetical protein
VSDKQKSHGKTPESRRLLVGISPRGRQVFGLSVIFKENNLKLFQSELEMKAEGLLIPANARWQCVPVYLSAAPCRCSIHQVVLSLWSSIL